MPAIVDPNVCNKNFTLCFSAQVCPEKAFSLVATGDVVIDSSLCGECAGPCLNFCDGYAIRYERDPEVFDVLRRETLGEISETQAVEERIAAQSRREEEEAAADAALIANVNVGNFQTEVLDQDVPVVVDFWAPWCGPCQQMAPIFEQLAAEYAGLVKFVKVNTDEEPQLAAQMGITGLPTVVAFHGGQPVDGAVGALSRPQLQTLVYGVLASTRQPSPADDGE